MPMSQTLLAIESDGVLEDWLRTLKTENVPNNLPLKGLIVCPFSWTLSLYIQKQLGLSASLKGPKPSNAPAMDSDQQPPGVRFSCCTTHHPESPGLFCCVCFGVYVHNGCGTRVTWGNPHGTPGITLTPPCPGARPAESTPPPPRVCWTCERAQNATIRVTFISLD